MKLTAPKQRQGEYYENLAQLYLEAQGLTLFAKNWHYKNLGELDLVMLDNTQNPPCLVIIEVRQRKANNYGTSVDTITIAKQRKILRATEALLQHFPQLNHYVIRFDVLSFDVDNPTTQAGLPIPNWLISAFEAG